jgi:o-succinylbenzoate synthase
MQQSPDVFDQLRALNFGPLAAQWTSRILEFKEPAKTSRNTLKYHKVFYVYVWEKNAPDCRGIGEAAPLPGLSLESVEAVEMALQDFCKQPDAWESFLYEHFAQVPSALFALEQALLDLSSGGRQKPFPSKFTDGRDLIPINGLIWMGSADVMVERINQKLNEGFQCLKLKIGGLDRAEEWHILKEIRSHYGAEELEIRVDANGAFSPEEAPEVLDFLAEMQVHSIEQPIAPGQIEEMAALCAQSPVPIALDEELIGLFTREAKLDLLETTLPAYIILKPSLLGGFAQAEEWIELAQDLHIGWWATSALESNVALNQISQWVYTRQNPIPQGLGTGQLYSNNLKSPLSMEGPFLSYLPETPMEWPD